MRFMIAKIATSMQSALAARAESVFHPAATSMSRANWQWHCMALAGLREGVMHRVLKKNIFINSRVF